MGAKPTAVDSQSDHIRDEQAALDRFDAASPVFVDPTGRRRRTIRMAAITGAIAVFGSAALVVAALLSTPIGPSPSLPEATNAPGPGTQPQQPPLPVKVDPTTTTSSAGSRCGGTVLVVDTTATTSAATTSATTSGEGDKPETQLGRSSDLPAPPGHAC